MFAITWVLSLCVSLLPLGLAFYCAYYDCEYLITDSTVEQITAMYLLHLFTHIMYQVVGVPESRNWMKYASIMANVVFVGLMWAVSLIIAIFYSILLIGLTHSSYFDSERKSLS